MISATHAQRHPQTDLALEATQALRGQIGRDLPGVEVGDETHGEIKVTTVSVTTEEGANIIGKPKGRYITIEAHGLRRRNRDLQEEVGRVLTHELSRLLQNGHTPEKLLVVGLGNWRATADSLGPKVTSKLLVTRHLRDYIPEELTGRLRTVSAISPGVLGLTGIETGEIVRGIVEKTSPDVVVAIDSLAARSVDRIITTVQLADTGIHPGSGLGNKRSGLTKHTLGVPVIAVGIPTVVYATTIASNALCSVMERLAAEKPWVGRLDHEGDQALIEEVMSEKLGDMVVTPKEIDTYIEDMATVLAGSLNAAFHPGISVEDLTRYLN